MGTTPFFFEETTGWSRVYRLELEKEGYEPLKVTLEQDNLQWRHACPAVCLCPPTLGLSLTGCLFSYGLGDEYNFVLTPMDAPYGPEPPAPPADGGTEAGPGSQPADAPKKSDEVVPPEERAVPF
jgi:hypothetical protein